MILRMTRRTSLGIRLGALLLVLAWAASTGGAGVARANEGGGEPPADYSWPPAGSKAQAKKQPGKAAAQKPKAASQKAGPASAARSARARPARLRETAQDGMPPEGETRFVRDQVIVRYRLDARRRDMDALVRRLNLRHVEARTFLMAGVTAHLYAVTDGTPVPALVAALQADLTVLTAQPNYLYTLMQAAAAGARSPQYALDKLAIASVHPLATGEGVPVAVIDSLVDAGHPEFTGAAIEVVDATDGSKEGAHPHGTSIAGVIASRGTLLGVAPGVRLLGIRAFLAEEDGSARGTSWRILKSLDQAHAAGSRVVNMSFAGPRDLLVGRSVAGILRRGMIAIAAAGNEGPAAPPLYPAAYPGVVAVTAIDKDDVVYRQASQGVHVALSAPGVDILVPVPKGGYQITSGTSLAAAHVSGLAALLLGAEPSLTAAEVADILLSSSADLGAPGRDAVFGAGLPDALAAIEASRRRR